MVVNKERALYQKPEIADLTSPIVKIAQQGLTEAKAFQAAQPVALHNGHPDNQWYYENGELKWHFHQQDNIPRHEVGSILSPHYIVTGVEHDGLKNGAYGFTYTIEERQL